MNALRATFYFPVERLCVEPDLLGTTHEVDVDGRRVRMTLPSREAEPRRADKAPNPGSFPDPDPGWLPLIEGGAELRSSATVLSSGGLAHVDVIRVEVLFDGDVGAASYEDPGADAHLLASLANESALATARRVVAGFVSWTRVAPGQPWLSLSGAEPWPTGNSTLEDLDAGRRLPYSLSGNRLVVQRIADEQVLRLQMLDTILARVAAGNEPTLAASVLADAIWLESHHCDAPRVVLTAAIACELKVKQVLRDEAGDQTRELVDVLLESPRDFSVAAAALFDRPMKAVAGRSLREDNRPLWKQVNRLFEIRNRVVHRGHVPSDSEADESLDAAILAFRWLDRDQRETTI